MANDICSLLWSVRFVDLSMYFTLLGYISKNVANVKLMIDIAADLMSG